jgi:hypothetical protein
MPLDVTLAHPYTDTDGTFYDVGERLEVEESVANQLIRNGVANPSTVAAAKEAGVNPDQAASKKS